MKVCPVCGTTVKGRPDKVYCSIECRTAKQYERRLDSEQFFLQVEKQLKVNRKILKRFHQGGKTTLHSEVLLDQGFNPRFFTHYWKSKKGQVYLFCYDIGFLKLTDNGKEKYLLVTWQAYMNEQVS